MKNRTACPHCKKAFLVKPELQGKKSRCPGCKNVFVISFENTPATPSPPAAAAPVKPVATPAPPTIPVAQTSASPAPAIVSPFESLATQHMSGRNPQPGAVSNEGPETDKYVQMNQQLRRTEAHQELDESAMRFVARGAALMLFGVLVTALAFIGIHMADLDHICPIGAFLGTAFGGLGAVMVVIGLFRRMPFAILLGGLPGLFFLLGACGVIYLSAQGYWNTHPFPFMNSMSNEMRSMANSNRNSGQNSNRPQVRTQTPSNNNFSDRRSDRASSRNAPEAKPRTTNPPTKKAENKRPVRTTPTKPLPKDDGDDPFKIVESSSKPEQLPNETDASDPFGAADKTSDQVADTSEDNVVSFMTHDGFVQSDWMSTMFNFRRQYRAAFGQRSSRGFPAEFVTESAGKSTGRSPTYVAHPDKTMVVGLNVMAGPSSNGAYKAMPVYSRSDSATSMAKPGYALGGINVLVEDGKINGIRCAFIKLVDGRLDTGDFYYGNWMGKQPETGTGKFISGDGKKVFGIWTEARGFSMSAIGLIRESK